MAHTHTNTLAMAKRVVACLLAVALCVNHVGTATAITFDSSTSEYYQSIDDFGFSTGGDSIGLRFGATLGESLKFNRATDKFAFSNDVDVTGDVHASGALQASGSLVVDGPATINTTGDFVVNGASNGFIKLNGVGTYDNVILKSADYNGEFDGDAQFTMNPEEGTSLLTPHGLNVFASSTTFGVQDGYGYFTGGNFGIGTSGPKAKLDVLGTVSGSSLLSSNTADFYGTTTVHGGNRATLYFSDWNDSSSIEWNGDNGSFDFANEIDANAGLHTTTFSTVSDANLASATLVASATTHNVGIGTNSTTTKAKLSVNGVMSGVTLYATKSFSGAGLTDCDDATNSKLLWDATTGRFSCGTDQAGGGGSLTLSDGDARYVKKGGDTMTGKLVLNNTMLAVTGSGQFTGYDASDVVLRVKGATGQSGNMQEWVDGNDTMYANISAYGDFNLNNNLSANYSYFSGNVDASSVTVRGVTSCGGLGTDMGGNIYCAGGNNSSGYFGITDGFNTSYVYDYYNISFLHDSYINVTVDGGNNVTISSNNSYANAMNQNVGAYDNVNFNALTVNTSVGATDVNASNNLSVGNVAYFSGDTYMESNAYFDSATYFNTVDSDFIPGASDTYDLGSSSARWRFLWAQGANVSTALSVGGTSTLTGNVGVGGAGTSKAALGVNGIMSGVTLYATKSFSGAGLTSCSNATTDKLLWNATTGRFSCGTDQSGSSSYTAGQGLTLTSTSFKVNSTLTGSMLRFLTVSGSNVFAKNTLASSGTIILKNATTSADMQVISTASNANGYYDSATNSNAGLVLKENNANKWTILGQGTTDNLVISGDGGIGSDDFVTVTQTGNVGLGTGGAMTPDTKLEVVGTMSGSLTSYNINGSKTATSGSILVSRTAGAPEWKSPTGSMVWYLDGTQATGASKGAAITMSFGMTLTSVNLRATGAPTGQALIVDIKENGTTLFSTKPQINAASVTGGDSAVFSDTTLAAGSVVTIDVTQVGSTFAGSGITIQLNGVRKY